MQNIHGESLNEFYVSLFRENFRKRKERLNALRTKEEALTYRDEVRRKIRGIFNLPTGKTPLEPVITKVSEHHGITVEHLYFYSRPGLPVTANLYYPAARKNSSSLPAVLYLMGHNGNGKAAARFFPLALAEKGFAVLVPDPIGSSSPEWKGLTVIVFLNIIFSASSSCSAGIFSEHGGYGMPSALWIVSVPVRRSIPPVLQSPAAPAEGP